jgi:hypothetical protein
MTERIREILTHLQAAADLAEEEAQEWKRLHPIAAAFRAAANLPDSAPSDRKEIGAVTPHFDRSPAWLSVCHSRGMK